MDTIYAYEKDNIVLVIEKSEIATYAKIDYRKTNRIGLPSNRLLNIYHQILINLKFRPICEDDGLLLYAYKNNCSFTLNFIKEALDERIRTMASNHV